MPRARVIHWKAAEAVPLIEACRGVGFEVDYLERDGGAICLAIRSSPPDVLVIDLSRLPSHGKDCLQGAHQDAQKSTYTTLPR